MLFNTSSRDDLSGVVSELLNDDFVCASTQNGENPERESPHAQQERGVRYRPGTSDWSVNAILSGTSENEEQDHNEGEPLVSPSPRPGLSQ